MPNTYRPPQPHDLSYGVLPAGPAFGLPCSQMAQRREHALRSFCLELLERARREAWTSWACVVQQTEALRSAHANEVTMPEPVMWSELQTLVGLCDRKFRTSFMEASQWPHKWPREGAPAVQTSFFGEACASFVPALGEGLLPDIESQTDEVVFHQQFLKFTEAACGKQIDQNAYGKAGDVIKLQREAMRANSNAIRLSDEVVNELFRLSPLSARSIVLEYDSLYTQVEHFARDSRSSSSDAQGFQQRIEGRALSLKSARSSASLLRARVEVHLTQRALRDEHFLELLEDDPMLNIVRFLPHGSALALMFTCKQFHKAEWLREKLPHLRLRQAVGTFPHHRVISFDRADLAQHRKRALMRNFVVSCKAVNLYIDFVVPTMRSAPLKKKPRTDGLDNRDHDFTDDEYDEPPESKRMRRPMPRQCNHAEGTVWYQRHMRIEKARCAAWDLADGPEEPVDRYQYMRRLDYRSYFNAPLVLTTQLVYADTHDPVPCIRSKSALDLSNKMVRDHGEFTQPAKYVDDIAPAHAKFHIRHLTLDHANRLFKLRIDARGTLLHTRGGGVARWTQFTEPFEVVSGHSVVKAASKRRTESERQAGIRGTKDAKRAKGPTATTTPRST